MEQVVVAGPQPGPQTALIKCPSTEIFFGGARGGGKTYCMLLDFGFHADLWGEHAKGIIFRRTYDELDEVVVTAKSIYLPLGAEWKAGARMFVFPNGATLKLRYLNRDDDADKYQGHQYSWVGFDEATNWASPNALNKLRACLRSAHVPGHRLRFILSGNPGGPGHNWVKARYVDPGPPMRFIRETDPDTGVVMTRVFIPSLFKDNPALAKSNPHYLSLLKQGNPEWLVKAWVEGDWNVIAGGMFDDLWRPAIHVKKPFVIPSSWYVDRSFDAGFSAPFSVGWWAESDGTDYIDGDGNRRSAPKGTLFRIAEWYGYTGTPNEGLRMLPKDIALGIKQREETLLRTILKNHQKVRPGPADTAIWQADRGASIADEMAAVGVAWTPADKSPGSRINGWQKMRSMMAASAAVPMEDPGLYVFSTCDEFLRTMPVLARDKRIPDDVDTATEDHIADEARYRCATAKNRIKVTKLTGL